MHQNYIKYNAETPQKFSHSSTGKERDSETGFSYFGARYYDSDLMTGWLSVDPMADKYPSLSPYAYCGWNPVKLVDPDGEDIEIIGKDNQTYYWRYGKVYPTLRSRKPLDESRIGASVKNTINSLNRIYQTDEGKIVLNKLSEGKYTFSREVNPDVYACYKSDKNTFHMNDHYDVGTVSHEIFHAYQDANGRGGPSIYNEVEAYVFQKIITDKLGFKDNNQGLSAFKTDSGNKFSKAINNLVEKFNVYNFLYAIKEFKAQSNANNSGTYEDYPLLNRGNFLYKNSLLEKIR